LSKELRYWDSDCFLGWLKGEHDKKDVCRGVVDAATNSEISLVTSSLTLVEVVKLKKRVPIPEEDAEKISAFFKNEFIIVQNVDRSIAESARNLIWKHGRLRPNDAIHLATAIKHGIQVVDTFDEELIKLSGKLGDPPIRIGNPDRLVQTNIFRPH
jgi:predicted nucleic acid-binding protein